MASKGRSRSRKEPYPAYRPRRTPSFDTIAFTAAVALANCPVCMRVFTTSVGTRTSEAAHPAAVAAASC